MRSPTRGKLCGMQDGALKRGTALKLRAAEGFAEIPLRSFPFFISKRNAARRAHSEAPKGRSGSEPWFPANPFADLNFSSLVARASQGDPRLAQ